MKKYIILLMTIFMIGLCGCSSTSFSDDEIYEQGYVEGYQDALDSVLEEIPWHFVDADKVKKAIYRACGDDDFYAENIVDQIFDECEIYSNSDLRNNDYNDDIDYFY